MQIIPEITLFNIIEGMIKHISVDLQAHTADETKSFLYRVLGGVKDHKHNYYEEAKSLFTRNNDNPRNIRTRLFFDAKEANIPTVHITMPQEQSGENSIGGGEIGSAEYNYVERQEGEVTPGMMRRFDTTYHIIITSDNHREVLIIYHTLRAALVGALAEVNIAGLENPELSGQDIRPKADIVPASIFMRGIGLQCSYEVLAPRLFDSELITQLIINPGTPINPDPSINGLQSSVTLGS